MEVNIKKVDGQEKVHQENVHSLKGTAVAVSVVGAVILGVWLLLFVLYMYRI